MCGLRRRVGLPEKASVELGIEVMALHPDAGRIDGVAMGRKPPVGLPDVAADGPYDFDDLGLDVRRLADCDSAAYGAACCVRCRIHVHRIGLDASHVGVRKRATHLLSFVRAG